MNTTSTHTLIPAPVAQKKGLFGSKFTYTGTVNPNVIFAHEIGHGVAYLQNPGIPSVELVVSAEGDGICDHHTTATWRDHATLQNSAEYYVSGCVFQHLYLEGDLSEEALYQKWLTCPNATSDRQDVKREIKVKPERLEQIIRIAIANAKARYADVGGAAYINALIPQATVKKGNKSLVLKRP